MIFSLHIGTDEGAARWRTVMARHGSWLGLVPWVERRTTNSSDPIVLSAGWLLPRERSLAASFRDTPDRFLATSYDQAFFDESHDGSTDSVLLRGEVRALRIVACLRTGKVSVAVPPATPEPCLIRTKGPETVLSNDLRIMIRWQGLQIDPCALWALYEYGAIPAPLTLDQSTQRVPDGHRCELEPGRGAVAPFVAVPSLDPPQAQEPLSETAAMRMIDSALDAQLARVPQGTVLYFSGGVDSALLASRLSRIGRKDVLLLNYLLGPEDAHSRAARQMAKRMGMPFEQIGGDLSGTHVSLERAALDYSSPFSDPALAPTNQLVHASLGRVSDIDTVIDGTAADGGFGFGVSATRVWGRAGRFPVPLRHVGGTVYRALGAWRYESRIEKGLRELRSLSRRSLHHAAVALGPIDGVAYRISRADRLGVEGAIASMFQSHTADRPLGDQLAYLALVQTCAARFAAKVFDPLRRYGVVPVYPYLDPGLIRASFSVPWSMKCREGEVKSLLKRMLLRDLPPDLVGLPKQGFAAPVLEMLVEPEVRAFTLDVVLDPDNPALDICSERRVRALVSRVLAGKRVSTPARRFLWSLVFTSAWIHGVRKQLPGVE